ncbi:MAG: hypothetical protein ACYDEE_15915, partial [Ignavibacteriaceae bacterium]
KGILVQTNWIIKAWNHNWSGNKSTRLIIFFGRVIGLLKQTKNEFMDGLPERRRNFWEVKNCA